MGAQRAAPEGSLAATSGGRINSGNAGTLTRLELPAHTLERLHAEGIFTLADWRALGGRRYELWGITRAMVREIDALARGAR